MVELNKDDRAYYFNRFYRHGVQKPGTSCLRFTPDYGHFRRHDDILKRLPCLQLKFQSSISVGMMMGFEAYHACGWQMNWFSGFIMTCVDKRADFRNSALPQCWQMPWSTEFNIARVDIQADFWNSALSSLTETVIFIILHCKIFTKLIYMEIQHCWIFAKWSFQRNYIANSCAFFAVWDKSENLHYKSTMPLFWNRQFCVKSTDFHAGKYRR